MHVSGQLRSSRDVIATRAENAQADENLFGTWRTFDTSATKLTQLYVWAGARVMLGKHCMRAASSRPAGTGVGSTGSPKERPRRGFAERNSALAVVQDHTRHSEISKPEVASALVRSHSGGDSTVYMRIIKSKFFLSDVLNTEHDIHFIPIDPKHVYSCAYSTRIAEVNDPGSPKERELPVGKDRGLLWRLYGYWFYEERDGGVFVECESVTLTRG
jgi:hypothetical protein